MIAGLSTFTWVHTLLSLMALVSGLVVVIALFGSRTPNGWTAFFLATAIATSATGFGFPFDRFEASHWSGVISLVALLAAVLARYVFHLAGAARWIYAIGMVLGFYFPRLHRRRAAFQEGAGTAGNGAHAVGAAFRVLGAGSDGAVRRPHHRCRLQVPPCGRGPHVARRFIGLISSTAAG